MSFRKRSDRVVMFRSWLPSGMHSNSDIVKVANAFSLRVSSNTKSKKNLKALNASIAT